MVTAKLIFQSIAGASVFGGLIGTGFWLNNTPVDPINMIVVFDTTSATGLNASISTDNVTKDYYCQIDSTVLKNTTSKSEKDSTCELYKLDTTTSDSPKTIVNLKKIISDDKNKASQIETNKKYILKLNKEIFDKISDLSKTVSIFKNKTTNEKVDKKLIQFIPKTILDGTIENPKTNLIVAQSFNLSNPVISETIDTSKKYFCEFEVSTIKNKFLCDIYKPTTAKTTNNFNDTELAALQKSTATSDIKKDNFFVIDLKNTKVSINDLRNSRIKLFTGASAEGATTLISNFIYEQALVGDLSSSTASDNFAFKLTPERETYYLTQLSDAPTTTPTKELFEEANNVKTQNYKCKLSDNAAEDTTCKLIEMPVFDGTKKSITLAAAQAASNLVDKKAKLLKDSYFKLVINHSNLDSWTGDDKSIDIISTTETTNTKYATLKVLAKENGDNPIGTTSYVFGKTPSTAITNSDTNLTFKCQIDTSTAAECVVYKFTTALTSGQTNKDLDFSKATKITAGSDLKASTHYLIDLKTTKFDFSSDKTKTIKILKTDSTEIGVSLEAANPIIGTIGDTSANNKVMFLN